VPAIASRFANIARDTVMMALNSLEFEYKPVSP
jgi:hypothetical protein